MTTRKAGSEDPPAPPPSSALPKCEHAWDWGCDCFCSKCGEYVCPTTVALTAENSKLREVMGAQVKVHAHRRYHRSSHPTCGVCITDDEARALLTEEGKP